jgi:hypothetical protein
VADFVRQKVRVGRRRLQPTIRFGSSVSHSRSKNSPTTFYTNTNPPGNFILAGCYASYIEARLLSRIYEDPGWRPSARLLSVEILSLKISWKSSCDVETSIAQNCGQDLRKLPPAHAWANSLPDVEISPYFSLPGVDLATGQTAECLSPHFCGILCRNRVIVLRRKGLAGVSKIGPHSG